MDGYLGCKTEAAVDAPLSSVIHIIYTFQGNPKVVDGLLFADGITIGTRLKVGG